MISVKIECACGQHYAFDVEPVNGRMPAPVACPACGDDGSAAANDFIAQRLDAPVAIPAAPQPSIARPAIAPSAPPVRRGPAVPLPGQPDRTQVLFEARAKISWGDSPQEVLKYLMINGISHEEANEFVNDLFNQRAAAIRSRGVLYIFAGIGLICVPLVMWVIGQRASAVYYWGHSSSGLTSRAMRALVITIGIGLGGIALLIKGLFMFFSPQSSSGDLAEQ
jgi:hypothetical protein